MGQLSQDQASKLLRLLSRTGEEYPLGGKISTDCFSLDAISVTPALRELAGYVCKLEKRIEELENDGTSSDTLNIQGVYLKILEIEGAGPVGTALPVKGAPWPNAPIKSLYFWDEDVNAWLSVEAWEIGYGRNTTNYFGTLYPAGNVVGNVGSLYKVSYAPDADFGMTLIGFTATCKNSSLPGARVNNCTIELWVNGTNAANYVWPQATRQFSITMGTLWKVSTDFWIKTAAYTSPNYGPDYPAVGTYWRRYVYDVTPGFPGAP